MGTDNAKAHRNKAIYNALPQNIAKRTEQNKARHIAEAKGLVRKGDGKAVDHRVALEDGGATTPGNLRVIAATKNKGWRKGTSTYDPGKGMLNRKK